MTGGLSPRGRAKSDRAYVTLVTNDDFALGAKALLRSLRLAQADADLVVLYTAGVSEESLAPLEPLGARLIGTSHLATSQAFNAAHSRAAIHEKSPFTKGDKPAFHTPLDNFIKLRLWQLEYSRVVFLDADTLVLRNIDRLFHYPEFSAAPNVYESLADFRRLNSGVFTARPNAATFERMMNALDRPGAYWRRTDQTFLEAFFADWHGLPIFDNMLQYVWFNLPELWHWPSIRVLHFQYEKPWQASNPKRELLGPLIDLWHAFADGKQVPDLAHLPPTCMI